jgi:predicted permease
MLSHLRALWRNVVHRARVDRDLDDEVCGAFEMLVQEYVQAGMDTADARRAAVLKLGRTQSMTEQVRRVRAGAFLATCSRDVRLALRLLRRNPVFAVFAIASLALGIGATAAIFSLFDTIVWRKLPVPNPDQLVVASFGREGQPFNYSLPFPHFEQIQARKTTLAGWFGLYPFGRVSVGVHGEADVAQGVYVTGGYYNTLGLTAAAGRLLSQADDHPGNAVAVLNHGYWRRRFGGRADVVGSMITLNQVPFTIVGVEPEGFFGTEVGRPYDVSLPMRAITLLSEGKPLWDAAFATWVYQMGRLKPGMTIQRAEMEVKEIFAQVSRDAARNANEEQMAREHQLKLESGATGGVSDLRHAYERWLRLLLMMLGAVLLLASLNVATLLLSRSDARQREITTRLALGAGRGRIIAQFLTESAVLAAFAAALGLALAAWGSRGLLQIATPASDRVPVAVGVNVRLLAFTALVSSVTCLLFGLVPAIRATSPRRLMSGRQIGGNRSRRVLDRTLVASQVALSLVLLVAAGLFLRTLGKIWAQDGGYDRRNVLMFSVDAHLAGRKGPDVPETYRRLLDELRAVPGAQSVTMSAVRPVSDNYYFITSFTEVGSKRLSQADRVRAAFNNVAPKFFETLGIPLIAGREFDERDSPTSPRVAIVSERLARRFEGNAVGQMLGSGPSAREVIGVVNDIRYANIKDAPREVAYFPMFQAQAKEMGYTPSVEVRFAGRASDLVSSIRSVVSRVDPGLTMLRIRTLEDQTKDSLSRERLLALMATYFGGFAVLLACIGLYGLMSFGVTQRTAEIGLRMALGAQPASVKWLVVREAAVTVIAGAAAGLFSALGLVRLIQSQLFGIEPHDPLALAGATAVLLILAFGAAYLPARRASRIDPLTALRHE